MAGRRELRLVRCPKCESLLPEKVEYIVFQCGGCGAVLRGKSKPGGGGSETASSLTFDEEENCSESVPTKSEESTFERRMMNSAAAAASDINNSDHRHHRVKSSGERRRRISDNNQYSDDMMQNWSTDDERSSLDTDNGRRFGQSTYVETWMNDSKDKEDRWFLENARLIKTAKGEETGNHQSDFSYPSTMIGSHRSSGQKQMQQLRNWQPEMSHDLEDTLQRSIKQQQQQHNVVHDDDDEAISSSSYHHSAEFYHGHEIRHIENHQQDEILRKLDEIKDQLITRQAARHINNVAELDRAKGKDDKLPSFSRRTVRPPNYGHSNCTTSVSSNLAKQPPAPPVNSNNELYDKPAISPFSYRDTHQEYHDPAIRYNAAAAAAYTPTIMPPNIHRVPRYGLDVQSKPSSVATDVQRRSSPSTYNNRFSLPIFGAAPFIICPCCFELLQLPNKSKKVRCGACYTTLHCAVTHQKKLLLSIHEETKESAALDMRCDIKFAVKGSTTSSLGNGNHRDRKSSIPFSTSEDFNRSDYEFHSMDSSSRYPAKQILSGDTETTRSSIDQTKLVSPVKFPPPPAGSTLQELFDQSAIYHRSVNFDKGNRSRSQSSDDHRKVSGRKIISSKSEFLEKQADNSLQFSVISHDSCDTTTREDDDKARKNHTKGLKFYSKESFSDISRSSSQDQENEDDGEIVTVNGHVIPDQLVEKAERMSGPIQPGDYWYDFRAGFWGVTDGPCLGIIPPSIEEFNYRMQEKCSGGNTGVYVNGRELHQKDMEMLGSVGLVPAPHKSYIVEISGKVWDEDSGEELFPLMKLAPTVEKLNRGFGIRVPKMR